jgi:hypothetical protein
MRPIRLTGQRQRAYACEQVAKAPEGWVVTLREPTRSLDQSARFHAMIDDLVAQKPQGREYDKEEWKAAILKSLGREIKILQDLDGDFFPVAPRSSKLTVREMSDAMEIMSAYGAQHGIVWSEPHPDERNAA